MESDPERSEEADRSNGSALRAFLTPEMIKLQYMHGVTDETRMAPESYVLDSSLPARPGNDDIQLDLFLDYGKYDPRISRTEVGEPELTRFGP